ncbi:glycoside hydrolase family 73 protein [Aneurinibacillus sp. REN35]|uniref:glycoside hydrolase family 73 protein n=1 Tax=Aneurinibacillus sp. REN35 TaxID=3237286 RepID=UPI0035298B5F
MEQQQFIASLRTAAIEAQKYSGIPASLIIAQAILESGWGRSKLTREAKNLFGIKGTGPAGTYHIESAEYQHGQRYMKTSGFRKYNHFSESIRDHTELLLKPRYAKVVGRNWREACVEVWRAGYATDPKYPEKLMKIIEQYKLYEYDKGVSLFEEITDTLTQSVLSKIGFSSGKAKKEENRKGRGLGQEDARKIIRYLQDAWHAATTPEEKREIGRLADQVRVSAGMKKMNS